MTIELLGYCDRWSTTVGETVSFMVSSRKERFEAEIVRLIHGDKNPAGPGPKQESIPGTNSGSHTGTWHALPRGSYVAIPHAPQLEPQDPFTLHAWVFPTTPVLGRPQGIITKWLDDRGYGLFLSPAGCAELRIGNDVGEVAIVITAQPLRAGEWYLLVATLSGGVGRVEQRPLQSWPHDPTHAFAERGGIAHPAATGAPLIIAGCALRADTSPPVGALYNGKIEAPTLRTGLRDRAQLEALHADAPLPSTDLLGAWDLGADPTSSHVADSSDYCSHGLTINLPTRGVTGHRWSGEKDQLFVAPEQYGAIHFHDDDLEDARWPMSFTWTVPAGTRSGVYAARLHVEDQEDLVPFVVRPRLGAPTARIAFLLPTLSHLAYGNEHSALDAPDFSEWFAGMRDLRSRASAADVFMDNERLLSLYDLHSDGTGNCYASSRRPLLTIRPGYRMPLIEAPHQFSADLYIVDWLEHEDQAYDVITDHDLHEEGNALLSSYQVVLTGTHPEYWTGPMLDALEGYLADGGRVMYLGGNGLYWVTSVDPQRPHVIEVRRGNSGTRSCESAPGECYHASTRERGGLWRLRGRGPNRHVGVGFAAQGGRLAKPYRRTEASNQPQALFVFAGIGTDEPIGTEGLVLGAAAGFEVDRFDRTLGSPAHALLIATAQGFGDSYQGAIEDVLQTDPNHNGTRSPLVRADMTLFETPNGGAVFATGSVAWCGALSANGYENPVARITRNVLRRFLIPEPLTTEA